MPVASGPTLHVSAQASGATASLNGHGVDSTFHGNPGGLPPGTCTFRSLTGSLSGSTVTLAGLVSTSTNPALVGVAAIFQGDASTGDIAFTFDTGGAVGGPFVLTGTGVVLIH